MLCLIVFGCQYQCNWLPGKTCLRMACYVSSGTLNPTHSLTRHLFCRRTLIAAVRSGGNYWECGQWMTHCHLWPLNARSLFSFTLDQVFIAGCTVLHLTLNIISQQPSVACQRGVRGDANTCWQCRMPLEYSSRRHPVHLKYRQIVGRPGLRYGPPGIAHIGPQTPSWWGGAGCPPRLAALRTLLNTTISNQFLL